MTKIEKYQVAIIDYINQYATRNSSKKEDGLKVIPVLDVKNHHYQAVLSGWNKRGHIHTTLFHFDIIDDKIWLQKNSTEELVDEELIKRGVPKKDIVIGFHPPYARQLPGYEFGVA